MSRLVASARMRSSTSCPAVGHGDEEGAGVIRGRLPQQVAAVFQHVHQPGERRRRDSLGRGQVAEPDRPALADARQRRQLARRQAGQVVLAQPPGQPQDGDPQPRGIDRALAATSWRAAAVASVAAARWRQRCGAAFRPQSSSRPCRSIQRTHLQGTSSGSEPMPPSWPLRPANQAPLCWRSGCWRMMGLWRSNPSADGCWRRPRSSAIRTSAGPSS